jgi:hypothetical protein
MSTQLMRLPRVTHAAQYLFCVPVRCWVVWALVVPKGDDLPTRDCLLSSVVRSSSQGGVAFVLVEQELSVNLACSLGVLWVVEVSPLRNLPVALHPYECAERHLHRANRALTIWLGRVGSAIAGLLSVDGIDECRLCPLVVSGRRAGGARSLC